MPGALTFDRSVFGEIAARVLAESRAAFEAPASPPREGGATCAPPRESRAASGLLGRLFSRGHPHPGVEVDESGEGVTFSVDVILRRRKSAYVVALDMQRKISDRVRHMTGRPCTVNVTVRGRPRA